MTRLPLRRSESLLSSLKYLEEMVAYHHPSPVRDIEKRQRREVRNALWSAWLRRPAASAWQIITSSLGDPVHRAGLVEAMKGGPWILFPVEIDRQLKTAEEAWIAMLNAR